MKDQFISESELGRILNAPAPKLRKALAHYAIEPDQVVGRLKLYACSRVEQIRAVVQRYEPQTTEGTR